MSTAAARTAALLRARESQARASREARARELLEKLRAAVADTAPAGVRVWLIGSLAWGNFGERSDVDLVLSGASSDIAEAIETAAARATAAPVDVLVFDDLPTDFRQRVERDGLRLA
ncbi:MAG TPA: nucleotidyltransferase domain-containing protein [Polyangiaceae bacterium]|nr:nucleotidyltransferase domain-containing protein [Polyangiaceae bacterium]